MGQRYSPSTASMVTEIKDMSMVMEVSSHHMHRDANQSADASTEGGIDGENVVVNVLQSRTGMGLSCIGVV